MQYLTSKHILEIHSIVIDETGGLHGVRDRHAILSLSDSPKQKVFRKESYPTIFLKAAVYAQSIMMYHPFLDGNKRTGMTCAAIFLENNKCIITAKEGSLEIFALRIVEDKLELEEIAKWFEKHSLPP